MRNASHQTSSGRRQPTKSSLSPARTQFLTLLQRINYGKIEGLEIRDGEPILKPLPEILLDYKLGGENGPRREIGSEDFFLKSEVVDLFQQFDQLQNQVIELVEVKAGLPFRIVLRKPPI